MRDEEMNIFLVEDNDLDVELFMRGIERSGEPVTITRARDGMEALEMLTGEQVDPKLRKPFVILLDINMPRMNGHEFLAAIRAQDDVKPASVFVFTTSDSRADIARAYSNHANGYIVKPTGLSGLGEVVQMLRKFWTLCEHPVRLAVQRHNAA